MAIVRVNSFAISLDGYGAGPHQSLETPLGVGGPRLFEWFFSTRTWKQMQDRKGARLVSTTNGRRGGWRTWARGFSAATCSAPSTVPGPTTHGKAGGARNRRTMWRLSFVAYPREPLDDEGRQTFHFVTDGIQAALERAKDAAKNRDVRIGGGVATVRQYLRAGLIDEVHLACRPILMGSGENLFADIDLAALGYVVSNMFPLSSRRM